MSNSNEEFERTRVDEDSMVFDSGMNKYVSILANAMNAEKGSLDYLRVAAFVVHEMIFDDGYIEWMSPEEMVDSYIDYRDNYYNPSYKSFEGVQNASPKYVRPIIIINNLQSIDVTPRMFYGVNSTKANEGKVSYQCAREAFARTYTPIIMHNGSQLETGIDYVFFNCEAAVLYAYLALREGYGDHIGFAAKCIDFEEAMESCSPVFHPRQVIDDYIEKLKNAPHDEI